MRFSTRTSLLLRFLILLAPCRFSILFQGATIVAFDEEANSLRVIRNGTLLVTNDRIAGLWEGGEEPEATPDSEIIDASGEIITPGFIDAHRHNWQTFFKRMGSNTTLVDYYSRYANCLESSLINVEDIYNSQLAGMLENLNAGVTTTLDYAHHTWSDEIAEVGLKASIDNGARNFWSFGFHSMASETYPVAAQIATFRRLAEQASFNGTLTSLGIACDFFGNDSMRKESKTIIDMALGLEIPLVTSHHMEGPWGFLNSPEQLLSLGILNTSIPVILSHATFISHQGVSLLRDHNPYISITPESEMHFGHTHVHNHLSQDISSLGVGTQWTFSVDILAQARLWLQRTRVVLYENVLDTWHIPVTNPMSVNQAFLLATRNGGLALRKPDLGVIRDGAKADLIIWNGKIPSMLGWVDPVAAAILHASIGDIQHVLVNGNFVKRNRTLAAENYSDIQARFLKSMTRIQNEWRVMNPAIL